MIALYNLFLYQPIFNLLVIAYTWFPIRDIGIAIIIVTILLRLLLYPLTRKSLASQKAIQEIQPKLEEIKTKYKDNQEEMAKAMMQIDSENKVNPFSSCLPILIQIPIFLAVYQVFRSGLSNQDFEILYSFVPSPEAIDPLMFGVLDLSVPQVALAVLAGLAQFLQAKTMFQRRQPKISGAEDENMMVMMNKQMLYMMPILTVIIGLSLPGGLSLYWFVSTLFMFGQQWALNRETKKEEPTETVVTDKQIPTEVKDAEFSETKTTEDNK